MNFNVLAEGNDLGGRRYVDPYPSQQMQDSPRKKRSTMNPLFESLNAVETENSNEQHKNKIHAYSSEHRYPFFMAQDTADK